MLKVINRPITTLLGHEGIPASDFRPKYYQTQVHYQECTTRGNPGWNNLGKGNVGSDFKLIKRYAKSTPSDYMQLVYGTGTYRYWGRITATYPGTSDPTTWQSNLDSYGPRAWNGMKPTKPDLDLAVSIAELSELPRLLKGRFDRSLRGVSNFWVALQFGWAPLLSDVKGMIKLQQTMHKRIMQLLRDNGRPVRREIKLEYERIVGDRVPERAYGIMSPIINGNFHSAVPTGVSWNTREYEIWASARFRYWLPKISDRTHLTKVLMRRLHGLEPTPSTIYNLVPWSWLVDWFTNVGEIISNLDAGIADRLAADYFYLMANERRTFYREVRAPMQVDNPWKSTKVYTSNSFTESEIKRRIRGSPFYPGLKDPDLSAIQLSILAALGYSRIRPTLD